MTASPRFARAGAVVGAAGVDVPSLRLLLACDFVAGEAEAEAAGPRRASQAVASAAREAAPAVASARTDSAASARGRSRRPNCREKNHERNRNQYEPRYVGEEHAKRGGRGRTRFASFSWRPWAAATVARVRIGRA